MTQPIGPGDRPRPAATTNARAPDPTPRAGSTVRPKADPRRDEAAPGASFRARLSELGPRALGHGGAERVAPLAGKRAPPDERPDTSRERSDHGFSRATATGPAELAAFAPADLAPFRVPPSILAPPITRAHAEPLAALDPALFSAEIVESLRLGRFGRDGHVMTMRLRGARSAIDVDVRSDSGRLSLRLSGDDDDEIARVRARVHADLAARGIEVDDEA